MLIRVAATKPPAPHIKPTKLRSRQAFCAGDRYEQAICINRYVIAQPVFQFSRTTDEIGMHVRFENVLDVQSFALRDFEKGVNIALEGSICRGAHFGRNQYPVWTDVADVGRLGTTSSPSCTT